MTEDVPLKALILSALWIIIRSQAKVSLRAAIDWRADAILYMDEHGQQTDGAKKYRREVTFPELP